MSWKRLKDIFARRLEDVFKTSWSRLEDVLKTFLQDVLKTYWRPLEDVLKTLWRRMVKKNILVLTKTSSEDVWLRRIYSSWSRRLEDVFKTSSKDEDERRVKMSSRHLHQDECLLGRFFWKYLWIIVFTNFEIGIN